MNLKPFTWLLAALIAAALLAGCGSSSSTTSSAAPATSSAAPATSTPAASSTPSATTTPAVGSAGAAAVAACKQAIQAQTTLPAGAKSKLEAVCAKAANGDQAAVRKAAEEVCEEVVNKSNVPAGAAREQALAACKSAG
jgi:hypothetical protein